MTIGYDDWRSRLDQAFTLAGDHPVDLTLIECTTSDHPQGPDTYSLTFRSTTTLPMDQGTHLLSADGLPATPVFLVPIARSDSGLDLQAVFTTMTTPTPKENEHE